MKRILPLWLLAGLISNILMSCDDNDTVSPARRNRVISMSHGDSHYRILHYDAQDRIVRVVHGLIDETSDSVETDFYVTYLDNRIVRIATSDESQVFEYTYSDGKITESKEYGLQRLVATHSFLYNDKNQVDVWVTKGYQDGVLVPLYRKAFSYDAAGNASSMEFEIYDPVTKGHELISTSRFTDFDDKKNSASLFPNFYHPHHVQFVNNARTWRVENTNGTAGESTYEYEYNADGYTTLQHDVSGNQDVVFQFDVQ